MTSEPVVRPRPRVRILALVVLVVYLVVCAYVLLTPNGDVPSSGVFELQQLGVRLGVPDPVIARTEQLANVAIAVPVPVLAAYVWRPWSVLVWTGGAFVVSLSVEVVQRLLLGERVASATDVVANTSGGLAGGLVSAVVMAVRGSRLARRQGASRLDHR